MRFFWSESLSLSLERGERESGSAFFFFFVLEQEFRSLRARTGTRPSHSARRHGVSLERSSDMGLFQKRPLSNHSFCKALHNMRLNIPVALWQSGRELIFFPLATKVSLRRAADGRVRLPIHVPRARLSRVFSQKRHLQNCREVTKFPKSPALLNQRGSRPESRPARRRVRPRFDHILLALTDAQRNTRTCVGKVDFFNGNVGDVADWVFAWSARAESSFLGKQFPGYIFSCFFSLSLSLFGVDTLCPLLLRVTWLQRKKEARSFGARVRKDADIRDDLFSRPKQSLEGLIWIFAELPCMHARSIRCVCVFWRKANTQHFERLLPLLKRDSIRGTGDASAARCSCVFHLGLSVFLAGLCGTWGNRSRPPRTTLGHGFLQSLVK